MSATTAAERNLVVIEDGLLATMANSPQYVSQFPFLAALAQAPRRAGGCGRCGRDDKRALLFNSAKAAIAGMAGENKRKLREMLNAKQLRVTYADGPRTVVKTIA